MWCSTSGTRSRSEHRKTTIVRVELAADGSARVTSYCWPGLLEFRESWTSRRRESAELWSQAPLSDKMETGRAIGVGAGGGDADPGGGGKRLIRSGAGERDADAGGSASGEKANGSGTSGGDAEAGGSALGSGRGSGERAIESVAGVGDADASGSGGMCQ